MIAAILEHEADFDGWRAQSRRLLSAAIAPDAVVWQVAGQGADLLASSLAEEAPPFVLADAPSFVVSRGFVTLAGEAALHRDPERFALLYRLLWRLRHGERDLLSLAADPEVARAAQMAKAVRQGIHKMHAFVRFREVGAEHGTHYLAWFEPEHYVLETGADFFARRFASLRWSILTPYRSAHWDGAALRFAPGARREDVPDGDALDEYWRAYYAAIFNPARLNTAKMAADMPRRYWRNLPEAQAIPRLVADAPRRAAEMVEAAPSEPRRTAPPPASAAPAGDLAPLDALRVEAQSCRRCPLWEKATQTVFGEGPADAPVMLIGEQPGDQEDLAGRPFVGPAGQLLDQALAEAGLDRARLYVTNAVKHFKFEARGKRRIHQKPDRGEIRHCRWWLERELALVRPKLVVALGASAAEALFERPVTIGAARGRLGELAGGLRSLVTVHPSYLLRLPDEARRESEYRGLVADLRLALPFS